MVLATGQGAPSSIASDGTNVYWSSAGQILSCPVGVAGCTPHVVASSQTSPQGVAVDGSAVYWLNAATPDTIMKIAK